MADERARKLAESALKPSCSARTLPPTLNLNCASEHFSNCFPPRPLVHRLLSSLNCIRSSSIFGMRPTPNGQSTDALRPHARRDKFAVKPCWVWTPPPRQAVVPFQKLATSPWESVCVRHPPGKCEPHTRKI